MKEKRILQTDVLMQSILILTIVITLLMGLGQTGWEGTFYLGMIAFILLLAWQFFSGIYIGVELKMRHRGFFQFGYFLLGIIGLLFTILGLPFGLLVVFTITPVVMLVYFTVCCFDLRSLIVRKNRRLLGDEKVLDSGELFEN